MTTAGTSPTDQEELTQKRNPKQPAVHQEKNPTKGQDTNFTPLILIQRDFQDTTLRTIKDNVNISRAKTPHPPGILAWCDKDDDKHQEFMSVLYENTPDDEKYITQQGRGNNTGGRGMDHIIANNYQSPHHKRSDINKHGAHLAIGASDHYDI